MHALYSTQCHDFISETNGKSLFDLLKEETEAAKLKVDNAKEAEVEEETAIPEEAEAKPAAKKAGGRKKKADEKPATEAVAEIGNTSA